MTTVRNGYHDRPPPCPDGSIEGASDLWHSGCHWDPRVQVLWPGQTDGLSPEEFTLAEALMGLGVLLPVSGCF